MLYIACPYSHEDRSVRDSRFRIATLVAGRLIKQGQVVYSAITHTHPINEMMPGAISWETWLNLDERIMNDCCLKMLIIRVPGWETSRGITREIRFAKSHGIEVDFIDPTPEELVLAGITN